MDWKNAYQKIKEILANKKLNLFEYQKIENIVNNINSDGYHTFDELYMHRMALTSELTKHIGGTRSLKHSDGTMFDDYFVVVFYPSSGKQCSYHYHIQYWDLFEHCKTVEFSEEWDGHFANDVVDRLINH